MPATYTQISLSEMQSALEGFQQVKLPNTLEAVFEKPIDTELKLRVYSSIDGSKSRDCGEDAIRVCLAWTAPTGDFTALVGHSKRVNRTQNWAVNLKARVESWKALNVPCPCCGAPMILKKNRAKNNKFWGCATWGVTGCRGSRAFEK